MFGLFLLGSRAFKVIALELDFLQIALSLSLCLLMSPLPLNLVSRRLLTPQLCPLHLEDAPHPPTHTHLF